MDITHVLLEYFWPWSEFGLARSLGDKPDHQPWLLTTYPSTWEDPLRRIPLVYPQHVNGMSCWWFSQVPRRMLGLPVGTQQIPSKFAQFFLEISEKHV